MSKFHFTHAIVCRIPDSYKNNALKSNEDIDLDLAREQHQNYVSQLRNIGLDVIELPPDENHPDCVFVEDTAIVCNGAALICRPMEKARIYEVDYIRSILKTELHFPVCEIKNENATLEGGDVLFTGKEFFVGISHRTNEAGAKAVAEAFPDFPCSPVKIKGDLHLKSMVSMASSDVICTADEPNAREVIKRIENQATYRYKTLTVPDLQAANVIYANGFLLYNEASIDSSEVFCKKLSHLNLKPVGISELEKANGVLSACTILVKRVKPRKY